MPSPTLVWFRNDLRLADHPALLAAVERDGPVVPVYIWSPEEEGAWKPGGASQWWLHHSLAALDRSMRERGSRLTLRRGPAAETLTALAAETGARTVTWSHRYEPLAREQARGALTALTAAGIACERYHSALLHPPGQVLNGSGKPFQVFTPFWKACCARGKPEPPLPAPETIPAPSDWPGSLPLSALELEPKVDWAGGLRSAWEPGEAGAWKRWSDFAPRIGGYSAGRDRPDLPATSRLSPHLHHGEITPRQIWHHVRKNTNRESAGHTPEVEHFLREIGWREFGHHLLVHFPHTPEFPLRSEYDSFPWERDPVGMQAWQRGQTGYPLVDAGLRELWATGWMHNRVRMVVASFLVKDLLISWHEGARWFWDTLVDASLANNTLGWQWAGGCGADAAPYFRVFNPVLQAEKFDPDGAYVRQWVPELSRLPVPWIHRPWTASPSVLQAAGINLGIDYPHPIVDHAWARDRALGALARISKPEAPAPEAPL